MSVSPKGVKHRSLRWQIDFAPWPNLEILKGMNDGKYEFLRVRREFRHPFVTAAGSFTEVERILIKTEMDGKIGFGEVALGLILIPKVFRSVLSSLIHSPEIYIN